MTRLLELLLGRLPIGWLQLTHRKGRFAAGTMGVAFAVMLVLFQTGLLTALGGAVIRPYQQLFHADILLSGPDATTLKDGALIPRQRVYDALSVAGVAEATPVHIGTAVYKIADGRDLNFTVYGVETDRLSTFWTPAVAGRAPALELIDTALIDARTRALTADVLAPTGVPPVITVQGRDLGLVGTFELGPGFDTDGSLIVSVETFLRLFPDRDPGAVDHVFVALEPSADARRVLDALRAAFPAVETQARLLAEAAETERSQQTTGSPVGTIFGFGAVMGLFVGCVIVYQVLSTEVSDHLREYATFKAIGYPGRYFTGIVLEQAAILTICGFIPGVGVSLMLYAAIAGATGWPMELTLGRLASILSGALVAAALSGLLAARKLRTADPADLY